MTKKLLQLQHQQRYERKRLNTLVLDYCDAYRNRYYLARRLAETVYKYEMAEMKHKLGWAIEDGREIGEANREMVRLNNVMSNIQTQLVPADGQVLRKRREMLEVYNQYHALLSQITSEQDIEEDY